MFDDQVFLTIGIASYNYSQFLERAFNAIKRQKFQDFEILYCDDGSTDASIETIHHIIADNPLMKIRLIAGENEGIVANKMRILNNAQGEYVMVCDADDWMMDDCLENLINAAQLSHADRIISQFQIITPEGKAIRECDVANPSVKWLHTLWHGCLFRTSIFRENKITAPKSFFSDDYNLIMQYNMHCKSTEFVRKTCYCNYLHGGNASAVINLSGSWKPLDNFYQVLRFSHDLCMQMTETEDREATTYQVIKFYDQALLTLTQVAPIAEISKLYSEINKEMRRYFPYYLKNELIRLFADNYDRSYGKKGIFLMAMLERNKLLLPVLKIYKKTRYSALFKQVQ